MCPACVERNRDGLRKPFDPPFFAAIKPRNHDIRIPDECNQPRLRSTRRTPVARTPRVGLNPMRSAAIRANSAKVAKAHPTQIVNLWRTRSLSRSSLGARGTSRHTDRRQGRNHNGNRGYPVHTARLCRNTALDASKSQSTRPSDEVPRNPVGIIRRPGRSRVLIR